MTARTLTDGLSAARTQVASRLDAATATVTRLYSNTAVNEIST